MVGLPRSEFPSVGGDLKAPGLAGLASLLALADDFADFLRPLALAARVDWDASVSSSPDWWPDVGSPSGELLRPLRLDDAIDLLR